MSNKSKCRTCGKKILETGNYQLKILKSKPIPQKLHKLIRLGKLDESNKDSLKHTKFGQFLLKRANATNTVEITCGQCNSSSQIKARKKFQIIEKTSFLQISTPNSSPNISNVSSSQRKKKRNKEVNAGLFIPTNKESETMTPTSAYEFKSENTPKQSTQAMTSKRSAQDKEKDMDNLRKALFKSKKKSQNSGKKTSLQDFLSSI